jgi:hypothetical protein
MLILATVTGRANTLGKFTGQFLVTVPAHGPPIVAQAYLKGENGSNERLTITLTEMVPSAIQTFRGTFTSATEPGMGLVTVKVEPGGASFGFVLKGETSPVAT